MDRKRPGAEPHQCGAIPDRSPDLFAIVSPRRAIARNRSAASVTRIRLSYTLMRERLRSLVGNPQVAREYYVNLLKNGGGLEHRRALRQGGRGHRRRAIPPRPSRICRRCVHEYPKVTQFYGALGQAYLANGQLKESQAVLDKAMILFPRNVPDHHSSGGNADACRRQQARASHPGRSVQSWWSRRPIRPGSSRRPPMPPATSPIRTTTWRTSI